MLPCLTGTFPEDDLCNYADLSKLIKENVPDLRTEIVDLGCGYSDILLSLYNQGYHFLTGIDIDYAIISKLVEKTKAMESLDWRAEDIRSLSFPSETFGCIFLKNVFSMDTLQVDICSVIEAIHEADRVLCHGGVLICISTLSQEQILAIFQGPGLIWSLISFYTSDALAAAQKRPIPRVPHTIAIFKKS